MVSVRVPASPAGAQVGLLSPGFSLGVPASPAEAQVELLTSGFKQAQCWLLRAFGTEEADGGISLSPNVYVCVPSK